MNILLIEDNLKLSENVRTILTHEGYNVDFALDGSLGIKKASINNYDLIILDLALPDIDGIEVCKNLRNKEISTPILMLTARINLESKVEGLDTGADDYLTKPFLTEELLARVRALTRRNSNTKQSKVNIGEIEIDLNSHTVSKDSNLIEISPTEVRIIEYLILNRGETKNASEIYESVWGSEKEDMLFSDSLKVHIAKIRQKLGKEFISTVNGFGYMIK